MEQAQARPSVILKIVLILILPKPTGDISTLTILGLTVKAVMKTTITSQLTTQKKVIITGDSRIILERFLNNKPYHLALLF